VHITLQAIEHAFKNETVGLVTREQFVEKRLTIEERLKEEEKKRRHAAEEVALRVSTSRVGGMAICVVNPSFAV
jgi:protein FAM50